MDLQILQAILPAVLVLALVLTGLITIICLEIRARRDDGVTDWEFKVDITKPPLFPPNREMWDGLCETKRSVRRRQDHAKYCRAYWKAMHKSRKGE